MYDADPGVKSVCKIEFASTFAGSSGNGTSRRIWPPRALKSAAKTPDRPRPYALSTYSTDMVRHPRCVNAYQPAAFPWSASDGAVRQDWAVVSAVVKTGELEELVIAITPADAIAVNAPAAAPE